MTNQKINATYGQFEFMGSVHGTFNKNRFFNSGSKESFKWNRIDFNIKTDHNIFLPVEFMGNKYQRRDELKHIHQVKLNLQKNTCFDTSLARYDAVEYLNNHLREDDFVLTKGFLSYHEYKNEIQLKFIINEIYHIDNDIEMGNYFTQEIIFSHLQQHEKEDYKVNAILIFKQDSFYSSVTYEFYLGRDGQEELINLFKTVPFGTLMKIHGVVDYSLPLDKYGDEYVICGLPNKKLIITGVNKNSIIKEKYGKSDLLSINRAEVFKQKKVSFDEYLPF